MPEDSQLSRLAEEFTREVRQGKLPDIEEYALKNPELADRIRELFPTLLLIEGIAATDGPVQEGTPVSSGPTPGKLFGHYRIAREIGRGGMGIVYEAVHNLLEKRVALKVLQVRTTMDAEHLERFFREARTAASLHHTNIVPVIDVGQVNRVPYYAMEFIEGRSLNEILSIMQMSVVRSTPVGSSKDSTLDIDTKSQISSEIETSFNKQINETDRFFDDPSIRSSAGLPQKLDEYFRWVANAGIQAAEGLAHAHERKVIHRDIKPSNLLIDEKGVLWITDFGLARRIEDPTVTHSGTLIGTPRYMSPEQAEATKRPVDQRTDIYSLGVTLYELLTCRHVFEGKTPHDVISQIIAREPIPPRRLNAEIPVDLSTIVMKAMAKRPEDRYQSASGLVEDLNRWIRMEPIKARRIGLLGRIIRWCRRNPRLAAVTAAAGIIILVLSGIFYSGLMKENSETFQALQREMEARKEADSQRAEAESLGAQMERAWKLAESERDRAESQKNVAQTQKQRADLQRDEAIYQSYRSKIMAADLSYQAREIDAVRELLDSCDPSLRGWEWDYLHRSIDMSLKVFPFNDLDLSDNTVFDSGKIKVTFGDSDKSIFIKANQDKYEGTRFQTIQGLAFKYLTDSSKQSVQLESDTNAITISPNGLYALSSAWNLYNVNIQCTAEGSDTSSHVICQPVTYRSNPDPFSSSTKMDPEFRDRLIVTDTMSGQVIATLHHPNAAIWTGEADVITPLTGEYPISQNGPIVPDKDAVFLNEGIRGSLAMIMFSFYRSFLPGRYWGNFPNVIGGAFSQDGLHLATWSWDNTIYIWDLRTQSLLAALKGHRDAVRSVSLSPDMTRVASSSVDGTIRQWMIEKSEKKEDFQIDEPTVLAYSPDGSLLAVGTYTGAVEIFEVKQKNDPLKLSGHAGPISSLAFSPDSTRLVSASIEDREIRLWDVVSGSQIKAFVGHTEGVSSVAFSPDGMRIASASEDKTIRIWNARSQLPVLNNPDDYVTRFNYSYPNGMIWFSNGTRVLAYDATSISIWDTTQVNPIRMLEFFPEINGDAPGIGDVAIHQDKIRIALTYYKTETDDVDDVIIELSFRVIDMESGDELFTINSPNDRTRILGIDLTPDAARAAVLSYDRETQEELVQLWDTKLNRVITKWNWGVKGISGVTGPGPIITLSPNGKLIAKGVNYSSMPGNRDLLKVNMHVIDADLNKMLPSIPVMLATVGPMTLFPDGKRIAFGNGEIVSIWNLETGKNSGILKGHNGSIYKTNAIGAITVTPDGSRILTAGRNDKTVRIWDAKRYELLLTLRLPSDEDEWITALAVSSDSKSIAARTTNRKIYVWYSDPN